jgi:hypothetical protein
MDNYHICYMLKKELCTGINISAPSYLDAIEMFDSQFPLANVVYISKLSKW